MKKLAILSILLFVISVSSLAQTSVYLGLNAATSTNVGFWGANPTFEIEHEIISNVHIDLRLNGFIDLKSDSELFPNVEVQEYHRSFYSDLGLNIKIIDRRIGWSVGGGVSYQLGSERYLESLGKRNGELLDFNIETDNFSRFGLYVNNAFYFGESISININVYGFRYWGEYMSIGPSFRVF